MRGAPKDMGWIVLILVSFALLLAGTERVIKWYKLRREKKKLLQQLARESHDTETL
ncbi:MAG: hypothetical protein JNK00_09720 [Flavipsychrobacter sp.]|nr:hypothetical protein [Flavipsychrobacter sp.]